MGQNFNPSVELTTHSCSSPER